MYLSDSQVIILINNLNQVNYDCEQVLKEGLDKSIATSLFIHYQELKSFLNNIEIGNSELKNKINSLPPLQEPIYLIEKVTYLNIALIGLISPYVLIILLTFTASVSNPLLLLKKIWADKQKRKIREIAGLVSSIKFILEYPSFFKVKNE